MPDFKDKVVKYAGYGFTDGQKTGLDELERWYNNPNDPTFTLLGRAGTGKTYILRYFVDKIVTRSVCVTAPTHKAVRVAERNTDRPGKTLQSLHGLRPNTNLEDFDLNNLKFDALGIPSMNNYNLVIVDECSMVNASLHELNVKRAQDLNVKILYVGDPMQLPPVSKKKDEELIDSPTFHVKSKYELTEIVRQDKDNPLVRLLELIVMDIKNDTSHFVTYLRKYPKQVNDRGEGYEVVGDTAPFIANAIRLFKSNEFSNDPDFVRIAAWKNDTIDAYNAVVRHNLITHYSGEEASKELIDINDLLIGYKTIVDEFNKPVITNSEDYVIKQVVTRMSDLGFKTYAVKLQPRHGGNIVDALFVDHRDKSFIVHYEKLRKLYFNALYAPAYNRSGKWKSYFEYKNAYLNLISFPIMSGDEAKAYVAKDIDYAFALTVHKLQGSTVNNTFVDLQDMLFYKHGGAVKNSSFAPNAIEIRNKLVYTAISRTSKFATIYLR